MYAVSLFSGAGGLDLGFEAAGFKTILAVDNMPEAVATLKLNRPSLPVFGPPEYSGDVMNLSAEIVFDLSGTRAGEIDIMIGGPPCQPFSVAAAQRFLRTDTNFKRVGFDSKEKGQLIFQYVELIIQLKPRVFLIENVPGILSIDGGSGISVVYERLSEAGYTVSKPWLLNAMNYGIPQSRKRAFVVGTINGIELDPPEQTHFEGGLLGKSHRTVAEALLGVSQVQLNNETRVHKEESIARYANLMPGQREPLGRVDRLDLYKPSKTVIAGGTSGGGRSHLHPLLARTLSVRESARIQTYPDDYEFAGKNGRQFTLVGNSVPPLLAEVLARHIGTKVFGLKYYEPPKHSLPEIDRESAITEFTNETKKQKGSIRYKD